MTDAKEYGKALFMLADECGAVDKIAGDVELARSVMREHPDYVKILNTPALSKEERLSLVDSAFASVDESVRNLLKILTEAHAAHLFVGAADEFASLYDDYKGILRVEAISAVPLTKAQISAIADKLLTMLGKTAVIKNTVDPSILGGMKLRYGSCQLDGSIKTRLDKFEMALKNTVI